MRICSIYSETTNMVTEEIATEATENTEEKEAPWLLSVLSVISVAAVLRFCGSI
jgi:hypothetical protein